MLRYPEPVLERGRDRLYFYTLAAWIAGLKLFIAAVSRPEWAGWNPGAWWPTIYPNEVLYRTTSTIFKVGTIGLALLLPVLLLMKLHRTRGLQRADTLPVTAAAIAIGVVGSCYLASQLFGLDKHITEGLRTITAVAALVAPVAFLVSLTQRRMAQASVADLVVRLADCKTLTDVEEALRQVLDDPALMLAVPAGSPPRYVTCDGHPLRIDSDAWRIPIADSDGKPVAMLVTDVALRRRTDLVHTAAIAGGFVLENGLLHEDLAAQLAEVQASRRRIAEAGLAERRRIERNLHDGAQQALLRVSSSLSIVRLRAQQGREAGDAIETAGADLKAALTELRNLARGIHPSLLTERGLKEALQSVVERLSVPATLQIVETRLADNVEATLYFVTCEALTNISKHARASRAEVAIGVDGLWAVARISDDGQGGARFDGGSGLAGMRDRVRALRGDLSMVSERGAGTTITVRIPCE